MLVLACLMATPLVHGTACGDGNCGSREGWLGCPVDCPRPPRKHLIVGGARGATTHVRLVRGQPNTFHVRLREVPLDKFQAVTAKTRNKQVRVHKTEGSGLLEPALYFTIYPEKLPVQRAALWLSVNNSRLEGEGLLPGDVAVFRRADGGWELLDTQVRTAAGTIHYRAESPGLGEFGLAPTRGILEKDTEWDRELVGQPRVKTRSGLSAALRDALTALFGTG